MHILPRVSVRVGGGDMHWKDLLELCVEYSHVRCTLCGLLREVRTQGAVLLFYDRKKFELIGGWVCTVCKKFRLFRTKGKKNKQNAPSLMETWFYYFFDAFLYALMQPTKKYMRTAVIGIDCDYTASALLHSKQPLTQYR